MTCDELWNKSTLKKYLRTRGIEPDTNRGQHFLVNPSAHRAIAEALGSGSVVVEIGAGLGSLTCMLAKYYEQVYTFEIDPSFRQPFLENLAPYEDVDFLLKNYLSYDLAQLMDNNEQQGLLTGNIPYNITSPILNKMIQERKYLSQAVLTVQQEVGEKILTEPGMKTATPLTFLVQSYCSVQQVMQIPKEWFVPSPNITSVVIKFSFLQEPAFAGDEEIFFDLVRGAFNFRRKTIRNGLLHTDRIELTKNQLDQLLDQASIDPRIRPEQLGIEEFNRMCLLYEEQFTTKK